MVVDDEVDEDFGGPPDEPNRLAYWLDTFEDSSDLVLNFLLLDDSLVEFCGLDLPSAVAPDDLGSSPYWDEECCWDLSSFPLAPTGVPPPRSSFLRKSSDGDRKTWDFLSVLVKVPVV